MQRPFGVGGKRPLGLRPLPGRTTVFLFRFRQHGVDAKILPPAFRKFEVDLQEDFGVDQTAMNLPCRSVDAISLGQPVQAVPGAREFPPGHFQRVHNAFPGKRRLCAPAKLLVQESQVEGSIVDYEGVRTDKREEVVGDVCEEWFLAEHFVRDAMHFQCSVKDIAFGIHVALE